MVFLFLLFLIEGWSVNLDDAFTNLLLHMAYKKITAEALRNWKFLSEGALFMESLSDKIIYLSFSTREIGKCWAWKILPCPSTLHFL